MERKSLFGLVISVLIYSAKISASSVSGSGSPHAGFMTFNSIMNVDDYFSVNKATRNLHVLNLNASHVNDTVSIRIETTTKHKDTGWDDVSCPIVFSLTQSRSTRSWALPMNEKTEKGRSPFKSYTSAFTVCLEQDYFSPDPDAYHSGNENDSGNNIELLVFVSTCNPSTVNYTLKFSSPEPNFIIGLNDTIDNVMVTPTLLHYYRFEFPDDVDRVAVEVESEDDICMTVAVQSPWCRLLNENTLSSKDSAGHVSSFNAFWQDMSTRAVIPVAKTDFSQGFFIGFMVHSDDERCKTYNGVSGESWMPIQAVNPSASVVIGRRKNVNITVFAELSTANYTMPVLLPLDYVLVIVAITTVIYWTFHCITTRIIAFRHQNVTTQSMREGDTANLLDNDVLANNMENGHVGRTQDGPSSKGRKSSFRSLFSKPTITTSHVFEGQGPHSHISIHEGNTRSGLDAENHNQQPAHTSEATAGPSHASHSPSSSIGHSVVNQGTDGSGAQGREDATTNSHEEHDRSESDDEDGNDQFSRVPPSPHEDDVLDHVYRNSVRQVPEVRFCEPFSSTGSPSMPSSTTAVDEQQYDGRWLKMDAFIRKRKVKKSLERIYLLIGAVGIFYGLPTVQLLYTYHKITESTGQTDLCYRNYLCSHRVNSWDDFNHIYSNIAYVLLSIVFCIFVRRYDKKVQKQEAEREREQGGIMEGDIGHGVVHQFGIFYALGLAFLLEGVLSAMYHVCPTQMNFQFDTSFMFILAALSTVKIYQFRHPNPICPHNIFGFLAIISFISVGGIILGSKIYEGVFIFLHIVLVLILSVYLYYLGYVRDPNNNPVTDSAIFRKCGIVKKIRSDPLVVFKPSHGARLTFILPLIAFNLAISISQILGKNPFPTYLVYIFAGNMMLYFVYYVAMKVYHGEAFNVQFIQPFIYLCFSFALGSLGILYFLDKKYNASLSPAKSRALNAPCIIGNFYDSHDVWHFLSAGSIFFFFMTLLTLDDGILQRPRHEIVAF